jgi:hypothetical protein
VGGRIERDLSHYVIATAQRNHHKWVRRSGHNTAAGRLLSGQVGPVSSSRMSVGPRVDPLSSALGASPPRPGLSDEDRRDNEHLVKPIGLSADNALFEQLVRIINEAQERDAEDERRLCGPIRVAESSLLNRATWILGEDSRWRNR